MDVLVNHLAPFLLTNLLLDALRASPAGRIVNVASEAHRSGRLNFDDLDFRQGYSGMQAYARAKLANILFTRELAGRLTGTTVTANALHPGVVATGIWRLGFAPLDRWRNGRCASSCSRRKKAPTPHSICPPTRPWTA
ncbi:MAG: hypothetical protein Fur0043_26820 [Anaerolineales bacterium]